MTFWGCVIPPGKKPTPFVPPPDGSRLHISQATLGPGAKQNARVGLLVRTGEEDAEALLLCAFRAGFSETSQLDILLSEYAEFTIEGDTAIHVTGYYMPDFGEGGPPSDDEDEEDDDDDEYGMPMGFGMDDDDDDEEEEEDEEEDEDAVPGKRSGVVIKELGEDDDEEEEEEEEKPAPAARGAKVGTPADHAKDFLPLSAGKADAGKKRAAPAASPAAAPPAKKAAPAATPPPAAKAAAPAAQPAAQPAKPAAKPGSQFADGPAGTLGSRKFDNGLEVINLSNGKPDGKVAVMGKKVQMKYVGRLKSNGKVFDASKGAPFTFRLGVGEVIKGWDVGVKGMRVGDKRRLVIPPDMAYGKKGAPGAIPPNAWLEFDIELVNVLG